MRRVANAVIAGVTVVALCSGAWLLHNGTTSHAPPQPSAAQAHSRSGGASGTSGTSGTWRESGGDGPAAAALPPSPPTRIRIPSLRVDAPLMGLGLTPTGSLDVPPAEKEKLAGWYEAGTTPGERGTAIVAGHVDNADGAAVFFRLGALRRGATVEVDRGDGGTALFTVDAVEVYDARNFPDEKVYGAASRPELRVITCGGGYSRTSGYRGNVVVFAHLTGHRTTEPAPTTGERRG
ncbi:MULTISPECIES: class F sortase [unclassified Streptomyces]|uniref:class F sortase n=1 Tax=unclassified Streptomyces TaxID=2593676 RepID=UPI002E76809C|nr:MULTISPECIES: class F sortase [unclassified Streptomyces]MEE1766640.1 class F sortase [Streptomyces sp. SP18BB07]MEE1834673.1 class F sortase [Streptomyces sp. SP17KL33]